MSEAGHTERLEAALDGRYRIERKLGEGGMASVYLAEDVALGRSVAIKVLSEGLGYSPDGRRRFVREAQTVASLSHPNIVPVFDVGDGDGMVWFVMAHVDGESLLELVEREGPLPVHMVRRVLQQVAQALAYAHARGIIHRDIKPANILIERDTALALVTDFGVARRHWDDDQGLTIPGELVGTASYMAPEQAMGDQDVDVRADMYSLGLVAYFMLAGSPAIEAKTLPAIIAGHVGGIDLSFETIGRRLPTGLIGALNPCVEAEKKLRHQQMEDLLEALRRLGGDLRWDVRRPREEDIDAWGVSHPGRGDHGGSYFMGSLGRSIYSLPSSPVEFGDTMDGYERLASLVVIHEAEASVRSEDNDDAESVVRAVVKHVARGFHDAFAAEARDPAVFTRVLSELVIDYGKGHLTVFLGLWPHGYLLHTGDARSYLLHDDALIPISCDAEVPQALMDRGLVTRSHVRGQEKAVVTEVVRDWGTVVLLCSSGLRRHVSDSQIKQACRTMVSARQLCQDLLAEALSGGAEDHDITIVGGRTQRPQDLEEGRLTERLASSIAPT